MKLTTLALGLSACGIGTTSLDDFHREYPYAETLVLEPRALASALAAIEHEVGGGGDIRALGLSAHADYLDVDIQDPRHPTHVDSYSWQDGYLRGPTPVRGTGEIEPQLFPLADIPHDLYGYAVKALDATREKVENGHVSAVRVGRSPDGLAVSISIEGPRDSDVQTFAIPSRVTPRAPVEPTPVSPQPEMPR